MTALVGEHRCRRWCDDANEKVAASVWYTNAEADVENAQIIFVYGYSPSMVAQKIPLIGMALAPSTTRVVPVM